MQIAQVALRAVQLLFLVIVTALIGNVIAEAFAGNPSYINFAIFVCVWCWIDVLYGIAASVIESVAVPIVLGVLGIFSTLFTFIAGVVLAAKLGVHSCNNTGYVVGNGATNGSVDPEKRCRELQAATAFFWFLFAIFAASTVLSFMSGRSAIPRGGSMRRGPQMSKV